jgi:ribosomal protein S18 acetylase RimI-like enzyme
MVDPDERGRGIGRELLTRYVAGRPAAWLCTHPKAVARGLYEAVGFRYRGDFTSHHGDPRVVYTWAGLTALVAK